MIFSLHRARLRFPALLALFAGLVAGLWAQGCANDGRTPLVLYSPHGPDLLGLMESEFEAAHPEIDVRWLDMGSQDVYDRIRTEAANPQADVWYGGPDTIFRRGAGDGLLDSYRPPWASAIPEASRGPNDLFFGLYRTAPVLAYNSVTVTGDDIPRDWDDLLDERFRGEILMRDPLASGTMRTLFGMVLASSVAETGSEERGWEWLRRLDAQTKEYILNPALMIEKLTRQEGKVTIWELTDMLWQRHRGRPLEFVFPSSGTPVINDSIGLVRGAKHPVEARAFIDWIGGAAAQELAARKGYRLPARDDLPADELPEWAGKVLAEMVPAVTDWAMIAERGGGWMETWDRTVRGRGAE